MARIIVMPRARRDVDSAIGTLAPNRYVLGPWPWMILVYRYDEASDLVFLLAMVDARSSLSPLH